jgi:uncharacterized protein YoxC
MNPETNQQQKILGDFEPWPSKEEQLAYWKQKEAQQDINVKVGEMLDTISSTMQNLLNAVKGLNDICEHQQKEIDKLKQKQTPFV